MFAFLARSITTVEVVLETCRVFARERRRLRAAGNLIPDFDLMIGATAVRYDLTLISNNRRHFQRIRRPQPHIGLTARPPLPYKWESRTVLKRLARCCPAAGFPLAREGRQGWE